MRVLVTGGAGFIGQHLVEFLRREHEVVVLDLLTSVATGTRRLDKLGIQIDVGDVRSTTDIERAFEWVRPELVYHLAAESHVDRSLREPASTWQTNAIGTQFVAAACARAGVPLVYCSTDEVYGSIVGISEASETSPLNPSSPYSASKAAGELAVRSIARSYGLRAVVTRGCNAFGPGQFPEKLVPIACRLLQAGKPVPVHGGGAQIRQWIHVEEFVEGLVRASALANMHVPTFNLAGPTRISVRNLVRRIARVAGLDMDAATVDVGDRPGQDVRYAVNGDVAFRILGYLPKRNILDEAEIRDLLEHYNDAGPVAVTSYGAPGFLTVTGP